jgi:hypothetical protein
MTTGFRRIEINFFYLPHRRSCDSNFIVCLFFVLFLWLLLGNALFFWRISPLFLIPALPNKGSRRAPGMPSGDLNAGASLRQSGALTTYIL